MRPAVMSSSFFWRVNGLALVHSIVERLLNPVPYAGRVVFWGVFGSRKPPLLRRPASSGEVRSLDDQECVNPLLSRNARAFAGDLKVLGMASSSMVLPRGLEGPAVRVRLRMEMPCRCLSLRFWASVSDVFHWHQMENKRMVATTGARVVEESRAGHPSGTDRRPWLRSLSQRQADGM